MYEEIPTNVLWFMGGFIFTLWILYPIAKAVGRPELALRGGAIYVVIWIGVKIFLHMVL